MRIFEKETRGIYEVYAIYDFQFTDREVKQSELIATLRLLHIEPPLLAGTQILFESHM